jgi:taurine transport system substrate-binding protein
MKNFLRIITVTLALATFTLGLSACGNSAPAQTENTPAQASDTGTVSQNQTPEPEKSVENPKTVTIGFMTGADDQMVVQAKGWYKDDLAKQGIELKYIPFNAGRDIINAMMSKSIDIGYVGDPPTVIGLTKSIPYEIFWLHNIIGESESLAVKNSANINAIPELKGKKIATTVSSTSHYSLLNALKFNGLSENDVQILDMNPPDIVAAWQRGDIDAAYTWQPALGKLLADGKILISSADLNEKGTPTSSIGIVRKEFSEKYPQIVTLYIQEMFKAYDERKNNPDGVADALAKALEIDKEEAAKEMDEYIWLTGDEELSSKYLGTSSEKGDFAKALKSIADFLYQQKSIDTVPDLKAFQDLINPKYLEAALKK